MTRIVVDPITRIEGHLRIDCEVDGGKVSKAWSSGQMWRGIELILQGPRPARRLAVHAALLRRVHHRARHHLGARGRERARARSAAQRAVHPQPDHRRARRARPHRALLSSVGARLGRRRLGAEGRSGGRGQDRRSALRLEGQQRAGDPRSARQACEIRRHGPARHLTHRLLGPSGDEAAARGQPARRHPLPAGARRTSATPTRS